MIMTLNTVSFMIENLTSNNDNDENNSNNQENDYNNLITSLKEIKKTIALLEKIIFK